MSTEFPKKLPNPHIPILRRLGGFVYDANWQPVPVVERKNWRYVVVERKQVGVSAIPDATGASDPVYWDYVFGGGHERYANFWYDKQLAK